MFNGGLKIIGKWKKLVEFSQYLETISLSKGDDLTYRLVNI